jgi:hypothetical protein
MKNNLLMTKLLAVTAVILVWLPIAATLVLSLVGSISNRTFLFDYLMPVEYFPLAIVGSGLLLWTAIRARYLARPVSWALDGVVGFLVASQAVAFFTGLSSGAVSGGWPASLANALLTGYILSEVAAGFLGIALLKALFKKD